MSDRDIIERDGRRFVLVPEEIYERMVDAADELQDIRAYDRAKAKPQEFVPAAMVDRLIAGENPLKVWREHRGLTQQALAERVRISTPYLSQLENGQREPSVGVLRALAAALGVDLEDVSPATTSASQVAQRERKQRTGRKFKRRTPIRRR